MSDDGLPFDFDDTRPRQHHYFFAHHALRSLALHDPLTFLGILRGPKGAHFLEEVWKKVA